MTIILFFQYSNYFTRMPQTEYDNQKKMKDAKCIPYGNRQR